jgi:hypothetical protein
VLAISALAAGCVLALLGAALFLNVLSLRELAVSTRLSPATWAVFQVRDEISHRRAQSLELLVGLVGVAMVILASWSFRPRGPGVRRGS